MSEPVFSDTTERAYGRLPEAIRREDINQDWTLKKWMSGVFDILGDVDDTTDDRFTYTPPEDGGPVPDTSDLVDPLTADAAWLPWLAQLVGVRLDLTDPVSEQREQISNALTGFRAGSKASIADVVRPLLTGSQYVNVYDHSVAAVGDGGQWDVLILTLDSETPITDVELIAAVIAAGVKPAGVELHHAAATSSWDDVESLLPTWDDWATWRAVEEVGF